MKVLSLKNPYGYLICHGIKTIENRSWKTDYRGELLIHTTGKNMIEIENQYDIPDIIIDMFQTEIEKITDYPKTKSQNEYCNKLFDFDQKVLKSIEQGNIFFQKGFIIGSVNLIDIVKNSVNPWAEKNCYNWILEDAKLFDSPIPCNGKLGLWNYEL